MSEGFANAIIGGAETLVRSAIRSVNYVASLAGWRIAKDGTAELNSATIRGSVSAGAGAVTLDATGLHIVGPSELFDLRQNLGFTATRNPDDGALARLDVQTTGLGDYGGMLTLTPTNPTGNGNTVSRGFLFSQVSAFGTIDTPSINLRAPVLTGKSFAEISIDSQSSASLTDDSKIALLAHDVEFFGNGEFITNRPRWIAHFGTPNIPNNAVTVLVPTVDIDPNFMTSGNTVVIPTTDVWNIGAAIRFATNAAGVRMIRIHLNGTEYTSFDITAIGGFNTTASINMSALFTAGDVLSFNAYQNSGGVLGLVQNSGNGNCAWVMRELQ